MNKYNFFRIEHKDIFLLTSEEKYKIGPYNKECSLEESKYPHLPLLVKKEDSIWAANRKLTIPPASFKIKRPGMFEDPYLRDFFHKRMRMTKPGYVGFDFYFVFGSSDIKTIQEWFDFTKEEKVLFHKSGFCLAHYKVSNILHGKAQSVSILDGNQHLMKTISLLEI